MAEKEHRASDCQFDISEGRDLVHCFDESVDSDTQHGGGHIAAIVVGPKVKAGYKSGMLYQHQNLLKTIMKALGLGSFPGSASGAAAMTDFF